MSTIDNQGRKLTALLRCIEAFQKHDDTMPVQLAHTFLLVALNEGLSMTEYMQLAGAKQSTMSRHLLDLGPRNRYGQPGLGLLESRPVPTELRKNEYTLTPKGRHLLTRLVGELARGS